MKVENKKKENGGNMKNKMTRILYYGHVSVDAETFRKLDSKFFIYNSSEKVKVMCANSDEKKHLESLGIDIGNIVCDWFKIQLSI